MENKRSIEYYESRMWDVKLEEITSNKYNAEILQKLRDNDPDFTAIALTNVDDDEEYDDFAFEITDNDDMGWLGYFIGRNSQLDDLSLWTWLEGDTDHSKINALAQGISLNTSILTVGIHTEYGELFLQHFDDFFRSNNNLIHLELFESDIGVASARNLAVVLRDMSLESFQVERLCYDSDSENFIDEGGVTAEIITSLRTHTNLERLHMWKCNLDRSGCMALGRLSSLKELFLFRSNVDAEAMKTLADGMLCCLESLKLSHMSIDYDKAVALSSGLADSLSLKKLSLRGSIGNNALQCLVAAMVHNTALEELDLSENNSITAKGLSSLSSLLQSDKCCLRELVLRDMYIGDDGAVALAEALAENKSLKHLEFYDQYSTPAHVERTGISVTGWSAFTRLLCDTSSISNTYLSNHTLERCNTTHSGWITLSPDFEHYLSVNRESRNAAMNKILTNYPEVDMKPFFQWQLKFLPLMVTWFKTARARPHSLGLDGITFMRETLGGSKRRELSAIFQFVRGLPLLTVAGWRNQKIQDTDTDSKKRNFDHL